MKKVNRGVGTMRILLTGGTGFIGRYVVRELVKRGAEVTLLTSDSTYHLCENFQLEIINTTYEYGDLSKKLLGRKFDIFYHLGWAGVGGGDKNNIILQCSNIQVAIDMMHLSKDVGCSLFIATGTVAEYVFCKDVIDFHLKQTPNDVYGATKVAVHYLLDAVAQQIGQDMIWTILPSTFGEGRKRDNIITYTIVSLLQGKRPRYGNLEQMWDFLYVEEVARALADIGERGKHNKTYGIGSGEYRLLKDYICTIRDMIDPELPLGIGDLQRKTAEPLSSCVNIEQLTKDTGFVPKVSFEDGIRRTIKYYKESIF